MSALFVKEYEDAIHSAERSLELAPHITRVYTKLALGYLLSSQYSKAEAIYLQWKGKHFYQDNRLAEEVFLKDLDDLEAAGITHPDFSKVRKLLSEGE